MGVWVAVEVSVWVGAGRVIGGGRVGACLWMMGVWGWVDWWVGGACAAAEALHSCAGICSVLRRCVRTWGSPDAIVINSINRRRVDAFFQTASNHACKTPFALWQ